MSTKTFDVSYFKGKDQVLSHKYSETWGKTELYCPHCGKTEVWEENGSGDYYVGVSYLCTECTADFTLPYGAHPASANDKQAHQRIKALRGTPQQ